MKTKLVFFGLLCLNFTFGQTNFSAGNVLSPIPPVPVTVPPTSAPNEIFRFQSGNVTQLDNGTGFNFTNSRWFSMGRVGAGTQTFYGLRFQLPNRGLVMGYSNLTATNPVIQWIGTGANLGNLEFRVANGFGAPGTPAPDLLVATMTNTGTTVFGNPSVAGSTAKVSIENNVGRGLQITAANTTPNPSVGIEVTQQTSVTNNTGGNFTVTGGTNNTGIGIKVIGGSNSIGIESVVNSGTSQSIGVLGKTNGTSPFDVGIYGITPTTAGGLAGFFDGKVVSTVGFSVSDSKLKENVKKETNSLEILSKLNAVTYDFKQNTELILPQGKQHGFIAQEIETVFPELIQEVKKPVYDKDGKIVSVFDFKAVNYEGLISVLTAGIQELNTVIEKQKLSTDKELQTLKDEIATLKEEDTAQKLVVSAIQNGISLEQNIPNPFTDRTIINYSLSNGVTKGNILIFDLTGKLIKDFPVNENKGQITVTASQIGKGLFIYSLVQNGQELISKKMIIN